MNNFSANLLVVDDNENNRFTLTRRLKREGYVNISEAVNGKEALNHIMEKPVDLVLLDLMMPIMDGFEVLEFLRKDEKFNTLPVIMISADESMENVVRGIELGAVDYLAKPFNPSLLRARVNTSLEKKHLQEVEKSYLELFDQDTGLPNRRNFLENIQHLINIGEGKNAGMMSIAIPTFHEVASSWGANQVSDLLNHVTMLLRQVAGDDALLSRISEDCFGLYIYGNYSDVEIIGMAQEIRNQLLIPVTLLEEDLAPRALIGVTFSSKSYDDSQVMLSDCDLALSRSRQNRELDIMLFDPEMQEKAKNFISLQSDLRRAIDKEEFQLFYQPLISLKTGKIIGAEGLIRWISEERGMVSPFEFIPVAEESGLILPIGSWVIDEGCRQAAIWREKYGAQIDFTLNLNVSPRQFIEQDVVMEFQAAFEKYGHTLIKAEVTESTMMSDEKKSVEILRELGELGVKRAMDDFGTGYSSLGSLQTFPFDTLKMDKVFVDRIQSDTQSREIVKAVIIMAHSIGLNVVAEGVETKEDLDLLREWGCDYIQGYYACKPLPAPEFEAFFEKNPSW